MSLITSKSGASFTDVSYQHVVDQLPKKNNMVSTATSKLEDAERDLNAILRANYDIMTPEEQAYYQQTIGPPPARAADAGALEAAFMSNLLGGQPIRR